MVAKAFQWASLALASWTLAKMPPLSPCGVLLCIRWAATPGSSSSFHLRQFFKEDIISLANTPAHSGPCGRDPGNPLSFET